MTRRRRLIVPMDGSDCALRALKFACSRFLQGGYTSLIVLHVQPPLPSSRFVTPGMIREYHEHASQEALAKAVRMARKLRVPAVFSTALALPAVAIVGAARKGDEIVMGTRGMGAVAGLVMGSVAQKVVNLASVPVTLLK